MRARYRALLSSSNPPSVPQKSMKPQARLNVRRTLFTVLAALIALLILIPLLSDVAGIRTT